MNLMSQSFNQRLYINGKEYVFDKIGLTRSVHLIETDTNDIRKVTED